MSFKFTKTPDGLAADYTSVKIQTTNDHSTISDLGELFKHFLLACGYSPTAVDTYFGDEE